MTYIGADPEFVIISKKGNPQPPTRYGFPDKTSKGNMRCFRDGFTLEVNTVGGSGCRATFIDALQRVLQEAMTSLKPGHRLDSMPTFAIGAKALASATEADRQFGCEPDYNAYTGKANPPIPLDGNVSRTRFAGGHMHLSMYTHYSISEPNLAPNRHANTVKWLDLMVGVPLSVIFSSPDEFERRRYYGRAGSFRPQKYEGEYEGLEYRVPSPRLFNHPALIALFYGVARDTVQVHASEQFPEALVDDVRLAIDEGVGGEKILRSNKVSSAQYSPDTIKALSQCSHVHKFELPTMELRNTGHYSWPEYPCDWGIPL